MDQSCRSRIIGAKCTANVFADLTLGGRDVVLPLYETVDIADVGCDTISGVNPNQMDSRTIVRPSDDPMSARI